MKIQLSKVYIDRKVKDAVNRAVESGHYILGNESRSFEEELSRYAGTKFAVLVGSGTAAIWLSLMALGVKKGDEIIVPSHTAFPTVEPVMTLGAKPVFVDIDHTYTIDPAKIESKINRKTAGIIPVHLYGHPANMDIILKVARKRGLFVLEDCCQAHGAQFKNKKVGSMGVGGCFSFYPSKNLTVCGDGGAVTTNSKKLADKIKMLRDHGRKTKYIHSLAGYNERFNEIQAAIGRVMLERLDSFNSRRRRIAALYRKGLKGLPLVLPEEEKWARHVYHMFVIRTGSRDALARRLNEKGIATGIHYPVPCHLQPALRASRKKIKLPLTEAYSKQILSLPIHPLMTDEEAACVCRFIGEALKK